MDDPSKHHVGVRSTKDTCVVGDFTLRVVRDDKNRAWITIEHADGGKAAVDGATAGALADWIDRAAQEVGV